MRLDLWSKVHLLGAIVSIPLVNSHELHLPYRPSSSPDHQADSYLVCNFILGLDRLPYVILTSGPSLSHGLLPTAPSTPTMTGSSLRQFSCSCRLLAMRRSGPWMGMISVSHMLLKPGLSHPMKSGRPRVLSGSASTSWMLQVNLSHRMQ